MQKQRLTQLPKNINPCNSCSVRHKGCGIMNSDLKPICPCATCLVGTMCTQVCIERFSVTEKHLALITE